MYRLLLAEGLVPLGCHLLPLLQTVSGLLQHQGLAATTTLKQAPHLSMLGEDTHEHPSWDAQGQDYSPTDISAGRYYRPILGIYNGR